MFTEQVLHGIDGVIPFTKDNFIVEVEGKDPPYILFYEFNDAALVESGTPLEGVKIVLES